MFYLVHLQVPAIQGWFFIGLHRSCKFQFVWHRDYHTYTRFVRFLWFEVGASSLPY